MRNLADFYEKSKRLKEAAALRKEADALPKQIPSTPPPAPTDSAKSAGGSEAVPDRPDKVPASATSQENSIAATPGTAQPGAVLIAADSEWKWLHPTDGTDPEKSAPDFHKQFPRTGFDDAKWSTGRDSNDPSGGFGYGLNFTGVDLGKPESVSHRRTAYFRHSFTISKPCTHLELRCRRDDGIIVYLDGKEAARDNMEDGPDAYLLAAKTKIEGSESELRQIPLPGTLAPGAHTLAISVHNTAQPSSDLRLGGVTLVELETEPKGK
jgi:hypothetical protein